MLKCKWFYKWKKKKGWTNSGHRLYGDHMPPENSIYSLRQGIKYQYFDDFSYWEWDVVQSSDGIPLVFHDATSKKSIKRMCPTAPSDIRNKSIYKISYQDLKGVTLLDTNEKIPTLSQIINEFIAQGQKITKPIKVELKSHLEMNTVTTIVNEVARLKKEMSVEVSFLMFKSKYKKVFNTKKKKKQFHDMLDYHGIEFKYI